MEINNFKKILRDYFWLILLWEACIVVFLFLIFIELPRKGFDFTDHGYYLYSAWLLAKGIVPSLGFDAIINTFFIKIGITNYLFFEQLFYVSTAIAVLCFWSSIRPIRLSYTLPLVIIISVSKNFSYMINYQTAPVLFLMVGFGLLYFAIESKATFKQTVLYTLAGLVLSLSAFSNISLLPTLLSSWILIWFTMVGKPKRYFFHLSYWITSGILGISYFLSVNSIFKNFGSPQQLSISEVLKKLPDFYQHFFINIFPELSIILIVALIFSLLFLGDSFLKNRYKKIILLIDDKRVLIFLILIVLFFMFSDYTYIYRNISLLNNAPYGRSNLIYYSIFTFYVFIISTLLFIKFDEKYFRVFIPSLIAFSYAIGLCVTTNQPFDGHLTLLSPAFITFACLLFEQNVMNNKLLSKLSLGVFVFFLTLFASFGVYFHTQYSYLSLPTFENTIKMDWGVLKGVYTDADKYSVIQSMIYQYQANNCSEKYFVAYPTLPLLYYIFNRDAPYNEYWCTQNEVSNKITKPSMLVELLRTKKEWCVIEAPRFDFTPLDYFLEFRQFLQKNSDKTIPYVSVVKPITLGFYPPTYTLYVK